MSIVKEIKHTRTTKKGKRSWTTPVKYYPQFGKPCKRYTPNGARECARRLSSSQYKDASS